MTQQFRFACIYISLDTKNLFIVHFYSIFLICRLKEFWMCSIYMSRKKYISKKSPNQLYEQGKLSYKERHLSITTHLKSFETFVIMSCLLLCYMTAFHFSVRTLFCLLFHFSLRFVSLCCL